MTENYNILIIIWFDCLYCFWADSPTHLREQTAFETWIKFEQSCCALCTTRWWLQSGRAKRNSLRTAVPWKEWNIRFYFFITIIILLNVKTILLEPDLKGFWCLNPSTPQTVRFSIMIICSNLLHKLHNIFTFAIKAVATGGAIEAVAGTQSIKKRSYLSWERKTPMM